MQGEARDLKQVDLQDLSMKKNKKADPDDAKFPLPVYKKEDDIYNKEEEVPLDDLDSVEKSSSATKNIDDGLDIPGSELDDADEAIGEEDEENNYYSLGGDNHEDLEEDKGDS